MLERTETYLDTLLFWKDRELDILKQLVYIVQKILINIKYTTGVSMTELCNCKQFSIKMFYLKLKGGSINGKEEIDLQHPKISKVN